MSEDTSKSAEGGCPCPPADILWANLLGITSLFNSHAFILDTVLLHENIDDLARTFAHLARVFEGVLKNPSNIIPESTRDHVQELIDLYDKLHDSIVGLSDPPTELEMARVQIVTDDVQVNYSTRLLFETSETTIERHHLYALAGAFNIRTGTYMNMMATLDA